MNNRPLLLTIVAVFAAACTSSGDGGPIVEGDAIGTAGAHEHGVIRMGLAVDGTEVQLDLQAPGDAAFGFEHAPGTDEEIATVVAALELLATQTGSALAFASDLTCQAGAVEILEAPDVEGHGHDADEAREHADEDEGHEHDEDQGDHQHDEGDHDHEGEVQHSEVRLTMSWSCNVSPEGSEATLQVEQLFADVHDVDLTVITSMGQAGARVEADATFRF